MAVTCCSISCELSSSQRTTKSKRGNEVELSTCKKPIGFDWLSVNYWRKPARFLNPVLFSAKHPREALKAYVHLYFPVRGGREIKRGHIEAVRYNTCMGQCGGRDDPPRGTVKRDCQLINITQCEWCATARLQGSTMRPMLILG